jgi:hypothetical protein
MSAETFFLNRRDQPGLRDLDDVVLLGSVTSIAGATIPAGAEGTVVAVVEPEQAYIVEFPEPEGTLANVPASKLARARQAAP